jgi:hypothetical protein
MSVATSAFTLYLKTTHTYDSTERFQYNTIYVLDVTLPAETLFAHLSTNCKRQLKHWDP